MQFSRRLNAFGDEIFASLNEKKLQREREGKKIYNLSVGTPDFAAPESIRNALVEAAKDPENWKYSLRDIPELTQSVCAYYRRRFGVEIAPEMVASCNGTQEGMGHIGLALCDAGDTVLLPSPCYPVFIAGAKMAEAEIFYYPMTEKTNFLPDLTAIPEWVARRAKYMVVSLPANPMGSVGTRETYEKIIAFAKKYDILIVHDNAYSDIVFGEEAGRSFLSYPGAEEVGVEFFSLSKSFNVTGARISFLVGRKDVVAAFRKLRSQIDFGMFLPVQKAAIAALNSSLDGVKAQCEEYRARRDELCGGFQKIGWNIPDSKGSMFVWAPVPKEGVTSMAFCLELMERSGVLCTPGSSFGPLGEGFVRFALVLERKIIREAVESVERCGILKE